MTTARLTITTLAAVLGIVSAVQRVAQSNAAKSEWEVLTRTPAPTPR